MLEMILKKNPGAGLDCVGLLTSFYKARSNYCPFSGGYDLWIVAAIGYLIQKEGIGNKTHIFQNGGLESSKTSQRNFFFFFYWLDYTSPA